MQTVRKKSRPAGEKKRFLLLIAAVVVLIAIAASSFLLSREDEPERPVQVSTAETLFEYPPAEVASITIRRGDESPWTVVQENNLLVLQGDGGFTLSEYTSATLLDAACILPCEAVLTTDPSEYRDHLADFGLDAPKYEAIITYSDGVTAHLRIGNPGAEHNAWYYMTVDDDDRLFTFSRGMVEALFVSRDSLWDVESPAIHKARIDRITLTGPDCVTQWTLMGSITDADAADKWRITAPLTYPADAEAVAGLLSSVANLRLGAYVGPATAENLSLYGFDTPRVIIDIHMAEGAIAVTNFTGAVQVTDYPASTVTFTIGGEKSDMVDYVRYGDSIFVSSHFTVGMFIDYDVTGTMSRYPVLTALGNLAALSIREGDVSTEYVLTRTEQVAANNELIMDDDGNPVYDITVTRNGETIDYAPFEAAYNALTLVTVSGTLPDGEITAAEPHTAYTFTDVDGTMHTVELAAFDALHDAVIVDGHQAFYLIKGGFRLKLD